MGKGGAIVGLNIGTNTIKAVELLGGRGGVEVGAFGIMPTPEDAISNGVITSPEVLGSAIKDMFSSNGIRSKAVISSVAGQNLVVRIIEVPKMSDAELKETMSFEVERQIPFAATEVIMDYKPLHAAHESPDAQNMEVLFCAAQEDMINAHVETLEAAGLLPRAIDIEPLAATRGAVELLGEPTPGETVALLNIGASTTDISVVRDGLLTFTRGVPVAGDSLSQAIMEAFGVEKFEAERIKKEMGAAILTREEAAATDFSGGAAGAQSLDFGLPAEHTEGDSLPDFDFHTAEDAGLLSGGRAEAPGAIHEGPAEASALSFDNPFLAHETSSPSPAQPSSGTSASDNPFDFSLDTPASQEVKTASPAEPASHEVNPFDLSLDTTPAPPKESAAPSQPQVHAPDPFPAFSLDVDKPAEHPAAPSGEAAAAPQPPHAEAPGGFTLDFGEPEPVAEEKIAPPTGGFDLSGDTKAEPTSPPGAMFDLTGDGHESPGGAEQTGPGTAAGVASPGMNPFLHGGQDTGVGTGEGDDFLNQENPFADAVASPMAPHTETSPVAVYQCLAPVLAELVVETRRSLEYYTSRYPDAIISRLIVLGGTARLKHLDKYLSNELGVRVVIANPFEQLTLRKKNIPPEYAEELGPTLAISVGLALRDLL